MTKDEDYCLSLLRAGDRERYLAVLFAPASKRGALAALYAFNLEIARIRDSLREPLAGEMKLKWWSDSIENSCNSTKTTNPILKALFGAIECYNLPRSAFVQMCDARIFDLYNDPMPSQIDLEGYLGETASMIIQLACHILDQNAEKKNAIAAGHAGVAQGLAGLIRLLPITGMRKQLYIPADILNALSVDMNDLYGKSANVDARMHTLNALLALSREHYAKFDEAQHTLSGDVKIAFLTTSMVPTYLKKIEKKGPNIFDEIISVSPLKRFLVMIRCAMTGRF